MEKVDSVYRHVTMYLETVVHTVWPLKSHTWNKAEKLQVSHALPMQKLHTQTLGSQQAGKYWCELNKLMKTRGKCYQDVRLDKRRRER